MRWGGQRPPHLRIAEVDSRAAARPSVAAPERTRTLITHRKVRFAFKWRYNHGMSATTPNQSELPARPTATLRRVARALITARTTGAVVNGNDLAASLGISRAAVWKHIQHLQEAGWQVTSAAGHGYHLVASGDGCDELALMPWLDDAFLDARRLVFFARTTSTNDDALRLAATCGEGELPDGSLVVTDEQTGGRGRRGRAWAHGVGRDVAATLVMRPTVRPEEAQLVTLAAAVAVHETVAALVSTGARVSIKWPNDVLVEGANGANGATGEARKVAGILAEMQSEPERVRVIALGVGLNVNRAKDEFPDEVRGLATSIAMTRGEPVSRAEVTAKLWRSLLRWTSAACYEPQAVLDAWRAATSTIGKRVSASTGAQAIVGVAEGIDDDGRLRVRGDDGVVTRVAVADVTHLR